jgi:hypothetical protein
MDIQYDYKPEFSRFHDFMKCRVREILLVSTPYDAFVLEEDGRLSEKILSEYVDLNLQFVPRIRRVSSCEVAFLELEQRNYDLVITMSHLSDMMPLDFGRKIKEMYSNMPVVMLTYGRVEDEVLETVRKTRNIDRIFYWNGDSKILLAIIKHIEDIKNLESDIQQGAQIILTIEDSPRFYSKLLPIMYTEIVKQTQYLLTHAVNDYHRLLRMRARPKILLADNYEDALMIMKKYEKNILAVVSDVRFPKKSKLDELAGFSLVKKMRERVSDLPCLLQSREDENADRANEMKVNFINKNSSNYVHELRIFIVENCGFGSFRFRLPDFTIIAEAQDVGEFEATIRTLPEESMIYHASNNHFSRWFRARSEFEIADELRKKNASSYPESEELRSAILDIVDRHYSKYQKGVIVDFGNSETLAKNSFSKIGVGSLGGKGRGVAFFRSLLFKSNMAKKYPEVKILTPTSFAICSDVFETFIEDNDLEDVAHIQYSETDICARFLAADLPESLMHNLREFLSYEKKPLAVRSSSILEDSQVIPFAGIYKTYMLPNNSESEAVRLRQLMNAIKLIYASVFHDSAKSYAKNAFLRIEEERMAILIQHLVGERHNDIFYPVVSGVAQSYNFYPYAQMKPEEGTVSLALGFGKSIVEGEKVHTFSPKRPKMNLPYSPDELLKNSQLSFYALSLENSEVEIGNNENLTYKKYDLSRAEEDKTLNFVASTYSAENRAIYDSMQYNGARIITFAQILKYDQFPLVNIINDFFKLGRQSFGTEVEIEFAVNITPKGNVEIYFLQIRPLVMGREFVKVDLNRYKKSEIICTSRHCIGNGIHDKIHDIVYIDPDHFNIRDSRTMAKQIGELNKELETEGRRFILLTFGRLGTSDPWLGIPTNWSQMSQAEVVVEIERDGLRVEPSQGSHFYHNLTTLKMGYFHVKCDYDDEEYVNWDKLVKRKTLKELGCVKLFRSRKPLIVKIDGRVGSGVIRF